MYLQQHAARDPAFEIRGITGGERAGERDPAVGRRDVRSAEGHEFGGKHGFETARAGGEITEGSSHRSA